MSFVKRNLNYCAGLLITSLVLHMSTAGAQTSLANLTGKDVTLDSTYLITLSLGPVWQNAGQTQSLYLQPSVEKTYSADKNTQHLFSGELFVAIQRKLHQQLQVQLGIAMAAASQATLSGSIWDDANPDFNNYTYNYHIQHQHLSLKTKLLLQSTHSLTPYFSASLGLARNKALDFLITPRNTSDVPAPSFLSNNATSLAYTLGFGLQTAITKHWQVGVGYELANWGKSHLAPAPGQTLGQGLTLNHLYTQQLQLSFSYTV